mmetsp:Transcript_22206/g.32783  ORF Transcript_22206/g.32783 Transcript_22206/m.32783 type:complete len:383 (+) Transcript_22206:81-1229(+)
MGETIPLATAPYAEAVLLEEAPLNSGVIKELNGYQRSQLIAQGYTRGLAQSLTNNFQLFSHRFWVVDNSGSMQETDGHRIVDTADKSNVKIVSASRWEEIRECVNYHVRVARLLHAPTDFRLLNDPGIHAGAQNFSVAKSSSRHSLLEEKEAISIMSKVTPSGCTPLTYHINEIYQQVRMLAPKLQATGSRAAIIIATDGLPTNAMAVGGKEVQKRFIDTLRKLEGLPVWVVIRLCTDDEKVVDFYNNLDDQLELSLDVLDDFRGEAMEVYEHNPWLNYILPIHRCREMGFYHRVFDLIDERALTKGEIRDFLQILFGEEVFDGIPDPAVDWTSFMHEIGRLIQEEDKQWNPVLKTKAPLIDMKALNKKYGNDADRCRCTIL